MGFLKRVLGSVRATDLRDRRLWIAAAIAVVVGLVYAASFAVDEPLRRSIERRMNDRLKGYTVHLGGASLHPHGLSIDLYNVIVVQDANPDPPVMRIARLGASVQWPALLRLRLVADAVMDRPVLYVNLAHLKEEVKEKVPVNQRGWQDALEQIYPLKINKFRVKKGEVTYVDPAQPFKPLRMTRLDAVAENIRNVKSRDNELPSPLSLTAVVFDQGRLQVEGRADFLAEPYPGIAGHITLQRMQVDYFEPVARRYNADLKGGLLAVSGDFEFTPAHASAVLHNVTVEGVHVEYVHRAETARTERQTGATAAQTGKQVTNRPDLDLAIERLDLLGISVAFVNETRQPPYRVLFTDTNVRLTGLTNKSGEAPARVSMRGKFMGSGATDASLSFRPSEKGGTLDMKVSIEHTDMAKMNDLLRSFGKIEVTAGDFSLFSEVQVKDGVITGYVKPLFKGITVANAGAASEEKTFGQKLKEHLVSGLAKVLRNRPRREVATKADLSGRLDNPRTSVVQIVVKLVQNAFFKAILPGFDAESGEASRAGDGGSERASRAG